MNKIREAFGQIKADEHLKEKTMAHVACKTKAFSRGKYLNSGMERLVALTLCLTVLLVSGGYVYSTPTMAITVDMEPSVKLGVNRFDRVVSVSTETEEAQDIVKGLKLRNRKCHDAVEQLMQCGRANQLRQQGLNVEFNVNCDQTRQRERAQECINQCEEKYGQGNGKGNGYRGVRE